MEAAEFISPGLSAEESFVVRDEHAANRVGSGSLAVLATPAVVAFIERVAHRMVAERLPAGFSSVGVLIELNHQAPTPVGSAIRVYCRVVEVLGRRISLDVQAWDETEQICAGRHQRVLIDEARFQGKVEQKVVSNKR